MSWRKDLTPGRSDWSFSAAAYSVITTANEAEEYSPAVTKLGQSQGCPQPIQCTHLAACLATLHPESCHTAHQVLLFVAACLSLILLELELSRLHLLRIHLILALQALLRKDGAALPSSPRHPNTLSCPLVHAVSTQI